MRVWGHGGDYGDLLAALPVIAHLGGGKLVTYPHEVTGYRMTVERAEALRPLMEAQPYITEFEFNQIPCGEPLDSGVRWGYKHTLNLADMQADWFKVPHWPREKPWLTAEPRRVASVVFARSLRWWNWSWPWQRVYDAYHKEAVFVGLPDEHREFVSRFGHLDYYSTANMLEVAQVINGADLLCCNQTSCFWIGEGLKQNITLEVYEGCPNCHFHRQTLNYCANNELVLWDDLARLTAERRERIATVQ